MPDKQPLSPSISVGDKIVKVGPPSWAGVKSLVAALAEADLPLPKLLTDRIQSVFDVVQSGMAAGGRDAEALPAADQRANLAVYGLLIELLADNLPTLQQWFFKHPPIAAALVTAGSNLSADEVEELSAGQAVRVARACWEALVADGFFRELAGFFGGFLATTASAGSENQPSRPGGANERPASGPGFANAST